MNTNQDNDDEEAVAAARAQQHSMIEEVPDKDTTQPPKETPKENSSTSTQLINAPEHPFQLAKDTTYSPQLPKMLELKMNRLHHLTRNRNWHTKPFL